jgi:hypothetical protein
VRSSSNGQFVMATAIGRRGDSILDLVLPL